MIEMPELARARCVLAVQPHYDDNDLGAGGTLAALADAGARIVYLTVSDDQLGVRDAHLDAHDASRRMRAEQREAGRRIGVAHHLWLDLPDAGDWDRLELRRALIRTLRAERPDFLFAPDPWLPYEAHPDHVRTGLAAAEACLLFDSPRLSSGDPALDAAYQPHALAGIAFYFSAAPNSYFAIAQTRERKHRAIDAYATQLDGPRLAEIHAMLDAKERSWGVRCGATHGEAFKLLSPRHLHCNPDAEEMFARCNTRFTESRSD